MQNRQTGRRLNTAKDRASSGSGSVDPLQNQTYNLKPRSSNLNTRTPVHEQSEKTQWTKPPSSQVSIRSESSFMRDSSRPRQLSAKGDSARPRQSQSQSGPPSSQEWPQSSGRPLSASALRQLNAVNNVPDTSSEIDGSEAAGSHFPWGLHKARAARGDLVKLGKARCTNREINLALSLTVTGWITGELGLEWLLWPEEDPYRLGDFVLYAWAAVERQQELDGYETHELEDLVARKMRDYISEKRSLLWKSVRDTVLQEYATNPDNLDLTARSEFWRQKSKNHTILSPDPSKPGWKKWTSDLIIKCLMIFYNSDNMWSKTPFSLVTRWWNPIRGFTIVVVSTMIVAACEENSVGTRIRFEHDNFQALFMQVKNSWQKQDANKELGTRLLVTKKVKQAIGSLKQSISTDPVPNEYEDTLSDLLDDPDFAEFRSRFHEKVLQSGQGENNAIENLPGDSSQGSTKNSFQRPATENANSNTCPDGAQRNAEDNANGNDADGNDADPDTIPSADKNNTSVNGAEDDAELVPVGEITKGVSEDGSGRKGGKRAACKKNTKPPPPKRRQTRQGGAARAESEAGARDGAKPPKILVRFNTDFYDPESIHNAKFPSDCTWEDFTSKFNQEVSCTMFWLSPDVWREQHRGGKGCAMCDTADLEKMFRRVQQEGWDCVYVIDAQGEFVHDKPAAENDNEMDKLSEV